MSRSSSKLRDLSLKGRGAGSAALTGPRRVPASRGFVCSATSSAFTPSSLSVLNPVLASWAVRNVNFRVNFPASSFGSPWHGGPLGSLCPYQALSPCTSLCFTPGGPFGSLWVGGGGVDAVSPGLPAASQGARLLLSHGHPRFITRIRASQAQGPRRP